MESPMLLSCYWVLPGLTRLTASLGRVSAPGWVALGLLLALALLAVRAGALKRMTRMLKETVIEGLTTNVDLLLKLLANEKFLAGNGDTSLVMQLVKK